MLLGCGLIYAWICERFHVGIACPFRAVTGFQCPGCGVSRMCLCLLHLDFAGAWKANPVVLCFLPILLYFAVRLSVRYIKTGSTRLSKAENVIVYIMIAILLIFGVVRNL